MLALQQLRALLSVREHGSLTRAASALHYGVPTVTHHLNTLERQLRVQLVERSKRGARLTELGMALATDAEEILSRVAQAERRVADAIRRAELLADPQELRPLPLAGLPGWHADVTSDFVASAPCFRPLRAGRRYPAPWCPGD